MQEQQVQGQFDLNTPQEDKILMSMAERCTDCTPTSQPQCPTCGATGLIVSPIRCFNQLKRLRL